MNMNNLNFQIVSIPENIKILQGFKKWRRIGDNQDGAIMIGLLEYLQLNNYQDKIQQIINNLQSVSDEQIKKMRDIISYSLQYKLGQQQLDYLIDQLKLVDPHSIFPKKLLQEYIKRVKGHISNEDILPVLRNIFSVKIIIIKDDNSVQTAIDPKDRNQIILYYLDKQYYIIQKEPGPQLFKCLYCQKQISEDYQKMKCGQIVCYSCLKKFFQQGYNEIRCKEKNCNQLITQRDYQNILNKQKEIEKIKTAQLNQIIMQKAEDTQKHYNTFCHQCKNRMSQDILLSPLGCSHNFCKSCLQRSFSLIPSGMFQCIIQGCKGKFDQKELDSFIKGLNIKQQQQNSSILKTEQQSSYTSLTTPTGDQEQPYQCEGCFNFYQQTSVYKSECSHKFCKKCCDKEIAKNISCFQCYKANCGYKIKIDDIQKYFYNKIKSKTFGDCANCKQECKIFESFQNQCQHLICYNCVKQIYTEGLNPLCKQCRSQINTSDLDDYYLPQASQEIQQIESFETNIQPSSCTFCNSPFTDYNLQQDILCQIHNIGSCCIILPLDCPQCQVKSLIIEKQQLKFCVYQNDMDRSYIAYESSIQ